MKTTLTVVSAVATVLMAGGMTGLFFVFSNTIMPALNASKPTTAIEAMQQIDRKILNPLFLSVFTLLPVLALVTGVLLFFLLGQKSAGLLFGAAAVVYFLGTIMPTAIVNVPMNNALHAAGLPADPADAARVWADYTGRWTAWNHLRVFGSAASLLCTAFGLYLWNRGS